MTAIIDFTQELKAIKRQYGPSYHRNPEAHRAAGRLWGTDCNDCGVPQCYMEDVHVCIGSYRAAVKMHLTQKDYILVGLDATTATGGFGYAPSVWRGVGYTDELTARRSGIDGLMAYFNRYGETSQSRAMKDILRRVINTLHDEKTPQLNLLNCG